MSRVIKFRAWEPDEEAVGGGTMWEVRNLEWDAGGVADAYLGLHTAERGTFNLMQFTGLTDKNGKEIYEGDILDIPTYETTPITDEGQGPQEDYSQLVPVSFARAAFGLWMKRDDLFENRFYNLHEMNEVIDFGEVEIIGNIYENSDLLV